MATKRQMIQGFIAETLRSGSLGQYRGEPEMFAALIMEQLDNLGLVIAPRVPTDKMICAALDAWDRGKRGYTEQYCAMIGAAI